MFSKLVRHFAVLVSRKNDLGATSVEYAIIGSLIAAVVAVSVGLLGTEVNRLFDTAQSMLA